MLLPVSKKKKRNLKGDGGVPLANSFSVSDKPRVEYLTKKAGQKGSKNQCPFRHGKTPYFLTFSFKCVNQSITPGFLRSLKKS